MIINVNTSQLDLRNVWLKLHLTASCLPVGLVVVKQHCRGLPPVGQSEIQAPQLAPLPVIRGECIVGIIRPMFVHYIADEGIVRGRLNTEAPALMDSAQPYEQPFSFSYDFSEK